MAWDKGSADAPHTSILDAYVHEPASGSNALRIFEGEWTCRLPVPYDQVTGTAELFTDPRIQWGLDQLGSIAGFNVLELGPLEAAHTTMIHAAGAGSVVAIEGNTRAFLKCLIVKELLGLDRAKFVLGDLTESLRADESTYDLVVASGVLYHLLDPVDTLTLIGKRTSRVLIWTHYYDADLVATDATSAARISGAEQRTTPDGFTYTAHRQEYGAALGWQGFCGGANDHSYLLERGDILACLDRLGFTQREIAFEILAPSPYPSFMVLAQKEQPAPS